MTIYLPSLINIILKYNGQDCVEVDGSKRESTPRDSPRGQGCRLHNVGCEKVRHDEGTDRDRLLEEVRRTFRDRGHLIEVEHQGGRVLCHLPEGQA